MEILDLPVQSRDKLGSAHSRRFRRAGRIPCVLYGRGQDTVSLDTSADGFANVQSQHAAVVRLELDGKAQTALIRAVQWDPFGDFVQHIDFVRVEMEDEVKLSIPVHFTGTPAGAVAGGVTQAVRTDVEVFARVDSIPSEILLDIEALEIGDTIYVEDVEYPDNVRPASLPRDLIVHVVEPKKIEEETEEELEEGEGAAPEGDPDAKSDSDSDS